MCGTILSEACLTSCLKVYCWPLGFPELRYDRRVLLFIDGFEPVLGTVQYLTSSQADAFTD